MGKKNSNIQALSWYRKAADQGQPDACSALGTMYFMGQGTKQSTDEAYFWYSIAAKLGKSQEDVEAMKRYLPAAKIAALEQRVEEWMKGRISGSTAAG